MRGIIVVSCLAAFAVAGCGREESAWEEARRANTVAAYEGYMERHPAGAHAAQARAGIRALEDDAAWARAERIGTPEAWQRYLAGRPSGRHAELARRMLVDFIPPAPSPPAPSPPGAVFELQLGAWRDEAAARAALEGWRDGRSALLEGQPLRLMAPFGDGPPLWRLRAGPLPESAARALCERIRAGGADCAPALAVSAGDAPP
jgi:hypothetical protein